MTRALLLALLLLGAGAARGQTNQTTQAGRIGIGGVVGLTSGLSVRIEPTRFVGVLPESVRAEALDVLAAWTFDGYLFSQIHFTRRSGIPASPLGFTIGPGIAVEFDDREGRLGASMLAGVHFFRGRFEVMLQVTPYLLVLPEARGRFTPAVGARFYP